MVLITIILVLFFFKKLVQKIFVIFVIFTIKILHIQQIFFIIIIITVSSKVWRSVGEPDLL